MTQQYSEFDAVIIGAGIVGATLAALLAKSGHRIAIVESYLPAEFSADAPFDLRVSAISRASQRALEAAGVWNGIQHRRAHAYEAMQVWDEGGNGEIRFDAATSGEPDLGHIIENTVIQSSLIEQLKNMDAVQLFHPSKLVGLSAVDDLQCAELDTGDYLRAPLIVGADGPSSAVRQLAGLSVEVEDYGQKGLVCVVKTEYGHQDTAWQRFLPAGPLAFLPLDKGYSSIVWTLPADQADRYLRMADDEFRRALADAFEHKLGAVTESGPRAAFALKGSQASAYIASGIALVGDAAHTIHPLAGQGVNLGIKDAVALADSLVLIPPKRWGSYKRLRRYERARKGDNVLTMRAMEGFKILFGHDTAVVKMARNVGLNGVNSLPWLKQQIMRHAMGL